MLISLIHELATAYGWGRGEILDNVYLDEALEYLDCIKRRNLNETLTQIVIASNPHTKDPKKLVEKIESELRRLSKTSIIEDIEPEAGAFDKLRAITGLRRKS